MKNQNEARSEFEQNYPRHDWSYGQRELNFKKEANGEYAVVKTKKVWDFGNPASN
jgi:hypothetical protein